MKKVLFSSALCFSLVFNIAVAGTLAWYWAKNHFSWCAPAAEQSLKECDLTQLRIVWQERQGNSIELRRKIRDKKIEIVDLIASSPEDLASANHKTNELVLLEGQLEREILTTLTQMMASLPAERRHLFLNYLKQRSLRGKDMRFRDCPQSRF